MTFRHFIPFLGIVLGLTLVPAALTANFSINDSVEAQITLTHDANWEFGVLSNGLPFQPRAGGTTTVPGEAATFLGSWFVNTAGNPNPGSGIIYFVDQAANKHSCRPHDHGNRRHSFDRERKHGHAGARVRRDAHVRGGGKPRTSVCVSDIVTANWSTVAGSPFGRATISYTIVSSACGRNLGPLPPQFAGLGVPDPVSPIEISGLFRNPSTAAPVAIPSNLTVQFVGKADTACKSDDDD
jgi:hypothetical protein